MPLPPHFSSCTTSLYFDSISTPLSFRSMPISLYFRLLPLPRRILFSAYVVVCWFYATTSLCSDLCKTSLWSLLYLPHQYFRFMSRWGWFSSRMRRSFQFARRQTCYWNLLRSSRFRSLKPRRANDRLLLTKYRQIHTPDEAENLLKTGERLANHLQGSRTTLPDTIQSSPADLPHLEQAIVLN